MLYLLGMFLINMLMLLIVKKLVSLLEMGAGYLRYWDIGLGKVMEKENKLQIQGILIYIMLYWNKWAWKMIKILLNSNNWILILQKEWNLKMTQENMLGILIHNLYHQGTMNNIMKLLAMIEHKLLMEYQKLIMEVPALVNSNILINLSFPLSV